MSAADDAVAILRGRAAAIDDLLRRLVRTRSDDSQIEDVCRLLADEARALGLHDIESDAMGNLVISAGSGPCCLLYDTHVDTVGASDRTAWATDPWTGREQDGVLHALGACDAKGCTPGMLHAVAALAEAGGLEGVRAIVFCNMEERAEGRAARQLVDEHGLRPDYVVIGEPTGLRVHLGHRGRAEYALRFTGAQEHGAHADPERSAIRRACRAVDDLCRLPLPESPPLGRGTLSVTRIHAAGGSQNVVPGLCDVYVDRRLTLGEDAAGELERIRAVAVRHGGTADLPELDEPTYTGYRMRGALVFPTWLTARESPLARAALDAAGAALGRLAETGFWRFSTNGVYWAGEASIPTVGFGPGDERHAHTPDDQVAFADVRLAAETYARLPQALLARLG